MSAAIRFFKRIGVVVLGTILILAGIIMLVTPGPGIVSIVAGLAVLGTEFERPKRWVAQLRARFNLKRSAEEPHSPPPAGPAPAEAD